jgi:hypothetical protein
LEVKAPNLDGVSEAVKLSRPRPVIEAPKRTRAEKTICALLFVGDCPAKARQDDAHRLFSISMVLSGLRCILSYVLLPFILPAIGAAAGVGPLVGIPVGVVALVFDVKGLRRFWLANHRWRWPVSFIYFAVMGLVMALIAIDAAHLA